MGLKRDSETGAAVFACTDEDLAPYVLPRDPRSHHCATPEERVHLVAMYEARQALRVLGWRDAIYAPQDRSTFLAIESGSSGVHECIRDSEGRFWVYDGDVWPARPILWKPIEAQR